MDMLSAFVNDEHFKVSDTHNETRQDEHRYELRYEHQDKHQDKHQDENQDEYQDEREAASDPWCSLVQNQGSVRA